MPSTDPTPAPRRILVPLDGSERAESVLARLEGLARSCGAELTLLRVNPPGRNLRVPAEPAMAVAARGTIAPDASSRDAYFGAEHYLDAVADGLRGRGLPVDVVIAEGTPGDVIVAEAEAMGADLIAMSTHGRGGLGRMVLGSVADHVLRHGGVPVLLVRAG